MELRLVVQTATVTRAVRRKVPEGFFVLFFGNNDTAYKFKRSELFQIFT